MNYRIPAFLILMTIVFITVVQGASNGTVSLNVYDKTVWWNDTVVVNGTAKNLDGSAFESGRTANVTLNDVQYCTGTTEATGFYTCNFQAPLKLGVYTLQVSVTNSTGHSVANTTTFTVKPNYGPTVVGKTDRTVFEVPMMIQDMNGEIRQIWTRVIVWKS